MSVKIPEPRVKTARWVYVRETREDGNEYAYYRCSNCVMTEQDSFLSVVRSLRRIYDKS